MPCLMLVLIGETISTVITVDHADSEPRELLTAAGARGESCGKHAMTQNCDDCSDQCDDALDGRIL